MKRLGEIILVGVVGPGLAIGAILVFAAFNDSLDAEEQTLAALHAIAVLALLITLLLIAAVNHLAALVKHNERMMDLRKQAAQRRREGH